MTRNTYSKKLNDTGKTPGNPAGGFLFDNSVLPFTVVIAGIIMACILSQITSVSRTSNLFGENESQIASFFTPEVQYWRSEIEVWSNQFDVDANLIATVMQIESCGDPSAKSGAGAMGLFQVMPYHFEANDNPYKPNTNANRGVSYLRTALDTYNGNIKYALAGYNGGISGAKRPEYSWPDETIRYVFWGQRIYLDAQNDKDSSARLDEWLNAGGASLCNNAAKKLGIK